MLTLLSAFLMGLAIGTEIGLLLAFLVVFPVAAAYVRIQTGHSFFVVYWDLVCGFTKYVESLIFGRQG
jgi:hypothetical protein